MINCEKALELINSYIDGDISESDTELLMSHIASCPECAELFSILTGVSESFSENAEPPEELLSGVMEGVRTVNAERKTISIARRRKMTLRWVSVAACAVLVVSLGVLASRSLSAPNTSNTIPAYGGDSIEGYSFDVPESSEVLFSQAESAEDSEERAMTDADSITAEGSVMSASTYDSVEEPETDDAYTEKSSASSLNGDYMYFSANYSKLLYVSSLPETISEAELTTTDEGTEYCEIPADDLSSLEEDLTVQNISYTLCEVSDVETDVIAVIITKE